MNLYIRKAEPFQRFNTSLFESDRSIALQKFIVTGDSRFRILNDYEDGLINKKYITYNKRFTNKYFGTLIIKAYNPNNYTLKSKKYNFDYITFKYIRGIPYVNIVWRYEKFTPYYVIYPVRTIKQETLDLFNIKSPMIIDNYELNKNNKILDNEYFKYYDSRKNKKIFKNQGKCKPPSIISKYGIIIKLQSHPVKNKSVSDDSEVEPVDNEPVDNEPVDNEPVDNEPN